MERSAAAAEPTRKKAATSWEAAARRHRRLGCGVGAMGFRGSRGWRLCEGKKKERESGREGACPDEKKPFFSTTTTEGPLPTAAMRPRILFAALLASSATFAVPYWAHAAPTEQTVAAEVSRLTAAVASLKAEKLSDKFGTPIRGEDLPKAAEVPRSLWPDVGNNEFNWINTEERNYKLTNASLAYADVVGIGNRTSLFFIHWLPRKTSRRADPTSLITPSPQKKQTKKKQRPRPLPPTAPPSSPTTRAGCGASLLPWPLPEQSERS